MSEPILPKIEGNNTDLNSPEQIQNGKLSTIARVMLEISKIQEKSER